MVFFSISVSLGVHMLDRLRRSRAEQRLTVSLRASEYVERIPRTGKVGAVVDRQTKCLRCLARL
jgi:hypothetical protein